MKLSLNKTLTADRWNRGPRKNTQSGRRRSDNAGETLHIFSWRKGRLLYSGESKRRGGNGKRPSRAIGEAIHLGEVSRIEVEELFDNAIVKPWGVGKALTPRSESEMKGEGARVICLLPRWAGYLSDQQSADEQSHLWSTLERGWSKENHKVDMEEDTTECQGKMGPAMRKKKGS